MPVIDQHDIGLTYELHRKARYSAGWHVEQSGMKTLLCAKLTLAGKRREEPDETWRIASVVREIVE